MRRILGFLAAAVVLTTSACGSSSSLSGAPASDPAGSPSRAPSRTPTRTPGPVAGARVLPLVSMTGAGGRALSAAAPLDDASDVARFVQQFALPSVRHRVAHAIGAAQVPAAHDLVGQVVMVGCDRPPGVDVVVSQSGQLQLVPRRVASPRPECLVAVTTLALAVVPATPGS